MDFSTERLFHSFWRRVFCCRDGHTLGVIASQPLRPVGEADAPIQVLVNRDVATSQCPSPPNRLDLQPQVLKAYGVVAIYRAFELQREDQVQVSVRAGYKRTAALRCCNLEATVEFGKCSWRNRLAASTVVIPCSRNSWGNRPCQVPKLRSLRPRACGE